MLEGQLSHLGRSTPLWASATLIAITFIRCYFHNLTAWQGIQAAQRVLGSQRLPGRPQVVFDQANGVTFSIEQAVDSGPSGSALIPAPASRDAGHPQDPEFEVFFRRCLEKTRNCLRAYSGSPTSGAAEDAVQDAFIECWRHWSKVRSLGQKAQDAYLMKTAIRKMAAQRKKERRICSQIWDADLDIPADSRSGPEMTVTNTRMALELLKELPRRQQQVVILRCCADMTFQDVASTLGISESSVRTLYERARNSASARRSQQDRCRRNP
jgi:RNA polymerase sigma factor (sigma-70 family)